MKKKFVATLIKGEKDIPVTAIITVMGFEQLSWYQASIKTLFKALVRELNGARLHSVGDNTEYHYVTLCEGDDLLSITPNIDGSKDVFLKIGDLGEISLAEYIRFYLNLYLPHKFERKLWVEVSLKEH